MNRSKGAMTSTWSLVALMATFNIISYSSAGPLGPLPMQNVTSADMGFKEGSCALGDVVYLPGDEFPGAGPCERCRCAAGGVRCAQQQCEPRPGCKALHRPDHCCPTYQCECEQEGRVYGNGEKLVDPQDPCRVCYCQGGEVVCRRIACFVRDDCTPRLVPGRCCPEYDNCPLRGVTSLPGLTTSLPTIRASSPEPALPAATEEIKQQQITIKEITPVSEIPIITDVKIKEILPSPTIEVAEYSSSKSPLIPREATSEKSTVSEIETPKPEQERPSVVEVHSSPETVSTEETKTSTENKGAPSKISLSTQDSINSEIYPSPVMPIISSMGVPLVTPDTRPVASTSKAPILEEEDPSLFDHNPAFPPLPDDLSVLSNHGDEIVPEPSADTEHMPVEHSQAPEIISTNTPTETTPTVADVKESLTTTVKNLPDIAVFTTTELVSEHVTVTSTTTEAVSTKDPFAKENPTINLRSAISTEISAPSSEESADSKVTESKETVTESELAQSEESNDATTQTSTAVPSATTSFIATTESSEKLETTQTETATTDHPEALIEKVSFLTTEAEPEAESEITEKETTTYKVIESIATESTPSITSQDQTTSSIAKSNVATEVTSQTELSSLPIETSDQNPHESSGSENVSKDTLDMSTIDSILDISTVTDKSAVSSEVIAVAKAAENSRAIENVETTEFILTSFGSSESSTDAVELIKIPGGSDKNAAIIASTDGSKNALTDLIKLVNDVASMSDHTDSPLQAQHVVSTTYTDSEELIPVNAGYKSKNSNFNQNSITEIPFKSKSVAVNKQKVVEIEDDDSGHITDSLPPNDKVEPTTRRPIIDNVSDDKTNVKTDKKDIEIITQSYVPTINRRPTKVILDENKTELMDEIPQDDAPASASSEMVTEGASSHEFGEGVTESSLELEEDVTGAPSASAEASNATLSAEQ